MLTRDEIEALPETEDGQKYNPANHTLMVLNRQYSLASTLGHRIVFRKGRQTPVPNILVEQAIAIGAERCDGVDHFAEKAKAEAEGKVQPVSPEERAGAIQKAVEAIMERNDRDDFTAAGNPTQAAVEKETGFKPDRKEMAEAMKVYHDSRAAS